MVNQHLTTKQVAELFGVTVRTVQTWANKGYIEVTRTAGGHRRIAESELAKLRIKLKANDSETNIHLKPELSKYDNCLNILIVDDDEHMLMLYEGIISEWQAPKVQVTTATDGYQALIAIGKKDFDVVFTDILMPHMDGAVMIKMILSTLGSKSPEIIVVTSMMESELRDSYDIPDQIIICEKPISYAQLYRLAIQVYDRKYMANTAQDNQS
jgi:excisionase family DNA binding protein